MSESYRGLTQSSIVILSSSYPPLEPLRNDKPGESGGIREYDAPIVLTWIEKRRVLVSSSKLRPLTADSCNNGVTKELLN